MCLQYVSRWKQKYLLWIRYQVNLWKEAQAGKPQPPPKKPSDPNRPINPIDSLTASQNPNIIWNCERFNADFAIMKVKK